jgi:iron(II)-dependent oxidoreductase
MEPNDLGGDRRGIALQENPAPRRCYPWGEEADPDCANYNDTGIATTSAVGCFPGGVSPYRAEDLSGNVLEWTWSLWGEGFSKPDFGYPYNPKDGRENLEADDGFCRVFRGGAFYYNTSYSRCAYRVADHPSFHDADRGFRVLMASFSQSVDL